MEPTEVAEPRRWGCSCGLRVVRGLRITIECPRHERSESREVVVDDGVDGLRDVFFVQVISKWIGCRQRISAGETQYPRGFVLAERFAECVEAFWNRGTADSLCGSGNVTDPFVPGIV